MPLWLRTIWATAAPDEVGAAEAGHREQLRALRAAGKLRAAGALAHREGYVEIFEAADRLEAEALARASPLVRDGLGAWTVRQWDELDLDG